MAKEILYMVKISKEDGQILKWNPKFLTWLFIYVLYKLQVLYGGEG